MKGMDRRTEAPVWTDKDAEGLPGTEDQPPGYDAETAQEGTFPPRDRALAADDWGATAREERLGESLRRRVAREQPDVGGAGSYCW